MGKVALLVVAVIVLVLALSSVALAATPQDIYNDYAQNGKLTGTYTNAELEAYLSDAAVHQYGDPQILAALDALVQQMLTGQERETFPFTGAELVGIFLGAVALAGGGFALRRRAKTA